MADARPIGVTNSDFDKKQPMFLSLGAEGPLAEPARFADKVPP